MLTNRIIEIITGILSFITLPIQIVSTFVLGIIVKLTFTLILIPLSIIWIVTIYGPLIGLSYIYEKVLILRIPVSLIGIPLAVLGYEFAALMPSMGETDSRVSKLLFCLSFPYSWHLFYFIKTRYFIKYSKGFPYLFKVFDRIPTKDRLTQEYIIKLKVAYEVTTKYE